MDLIGFGTPDCMLGISNIRDFYVRNDQLWAGACDSGRSNTPPKMPSKVFQVSQRMTPLVRVSIIRAGVCNHAPSVFCDIINDIEVNAAKGKLIPQCGKLNSS